MKKSVAGTHDGTFGHTEHAYGDKVFNIEDPAFEKGMENAGFEYPTGDDKVFDLEYAKLEGGKMQRGRFGGETPFFPAGTSGQGRRRGETKGVPASAKMPAGPKERRY